MVKWDVTRAAAYQIPYSNSFAFSYCLRSRLHARCYATAGQSAVKWPVRNRPQKSLQVSVREDMNREIPKDLGILPGE